MSELIRISKEMLFVLCWDECTEEISAKPRADVIRARAASSWWVLMLEYCRCVQGTCSTCKHFTMQICLPGWTGIIKARLVLILSSIRTTHSDPVFRRLDPSLFRHNLQFVVVPQAICLNESLFLSFDFCTYRGSISIKVWNTSNRCQSNSSLMIIHSVQEVI